MKTARRSNLRAVFISGILCKTGLKSIPDLHTDISSRLPHVNGFNEGKMVEITFVKQVGAKGYQAPAVLFAEGRRDAREKVRQEIAACCRFKLCYLILPAIETGL